MRLAIIGCGEIGTLRAAAISRLPSCQLDVVSDVDQARARVLAVRYSAAVEVDWRALLHRQHLEAVVIATPPHLHAQMCIEALQAGKHVLCEKPLARTPDECRQILKAAAQSGQFLATGFNYRFYPAFQKARQLLDAGVIGVLDHIRSYAGYSATTHNHPWLREVAVVGGGALRDNGIHLIDLTRYFLGEVAEVTGFASNMVWGFAGCEDNGFALLRSPAGCIASLQASWTEWRKYRFRIELYGTQGCISASCFPMLTRVVWATERGGRTQRRTYFFPISQIMEHLRSYQWIVLQSFIHELQAFVRATHGEPAALATGYDGMRAVEIAHTVSCQAFNRQSEVLHAKTD